MRLSKLIEAVKNGKIIFEGEWEREILELSTDSKQRTKNGLFFCLKGGTSDGHLYAAEAVRNGAIAIVTEKELSLSVPQFLVKNVREILPKFSSVFHGKPSEGLKVIGITGTNGKTTTSYMLASILKEAGKNVGIIGTLGVCYGGKKFPSELTTPDPIELHKTLANMRICGVEYVVMEVSAHALYYQKTEGIRFEACIFTNLTQDHLDFFSSMNAYKGAKMELFRSKICPIAVFNGDDEVGREFGKMREGKGVKTLYYGLNTPSDAFAIVTDETLKGSECMLNINDELCRVSLSLAGRHNIYNALAAAACASELGISAHSISKGLAKINGVDGRLQWTGNYHGADIFVDFAHTPDGLGKSLDALRPHAKGRLICLFGCGGNRDKSKRPLMGEIAAKKSDFAILTSDNPRYEDPLDIISDVEKGYRRFSVRYVVVPERKRAIDYAMEFLKAGDVLLIAGKGGETYQEIMGIKYPFNDHDVVKRILEKKEK